MSRPVDEHRMGTGTGMKKKSKVVAETGTGTGLDIETRTGSGRAKEWRRSARNRTRVVSAMWETEETRLEREKTR